MKLTRVRAGADLEPLLVKSHVTGLFNLSGERVSLGGPEESAGCVTCRPPSSIDLVCIIQDDNEDWQAQASNMGSIYSSSFLAIAAHPTEDMRGEVDAGVDNGCHLSRIKAICEIEALDTTGNTFSVFCRKTHEHEQFVGRSLKEGASTYFKRAWCFQERLLAPRILHFMQSEVVFECSSGLQCECSQATHYAKSGLTLIHFQLRPRFEGPPRT
jgi:hypothetical protein